MHLFVGSYSRPRPAIPNAYSRGVVCIEVEPEHKRWRLAAEPCPLVDPTYQAWTPDGTLLLSVADGGSSGPHHLVALRVGADGASLTPLGKAETHGQSSCHIAALPGGEVFAAASYNNACLDTFRVSAEGAVVPESSYRYQGSSVHPRQKESHAHHACVAPDGQWLYVCDLGADCVWKHPIDPQTQGVGPVAEKIPVPAGEGPRHMVFDAAAGRAYIIAELTGHLLAFDWLPQEQGTLRFKGALAGLPTDFKGNPSGAAIVRHPSGKAILASQRQHNSVAFFAVDADATEPVAATTHATEPVAATTPPATVTTVPAAASASVVTGSAAPVAAATGIAGVRLVKNLPSHGSEPRDFTVDASGRWLFVANQSSDTITVFELDPANGLPLHDQPHFVIETGTPVCVLARG